MIQIGFGLITAVLVGGILWRRKVNEVPDRWRRWVDGVEIVATGLLVAFVLLRSFRDALTPLPWDFPVFYTVASSAVNGASFYDPASLSASFMEIQHQWAVPGDWLGEVGFWYAPQTALYLAPLGLLSYPAALISNNLFQAVLLGVAIILLHRYFPVYPGHMGLVEMTLLALLFRPVLTAFGLSQIVFGALFCLVVATSTVGTNSRLGGLALGIGALFKHVLIIPALLAIALRKWRMALWALIGLVATILGAGLVFGFDVYTEFLANGPSDRSPQLALDPVIQSLNGVMRRTFNAVPSSPGALDTIMYPPYLIAAGLLTVLTLTITWKAGAVARGVLPGFALVTLLSLIVYPNTLFNTLPLMIPPLVIFLHRADDLGVSRRVLVVLVAGIYGAAVFSRLGFAALMVAWVALAGSILRFLVTSKAQTTFSTSSPVES